MKNNIRILDIILSFLGLILLAPLLLLIALLIKITSKGPAIFRQQRVGQNGKEFTIFKFRTMTVRQENGNMLTIGDKDKRITTIGYWLRRFKLDELPQLFNVLIGDMSIVGPRPELKKYVELYSLEQKKILTIKPGITDVASVEYRNESELLATAANPEEYYIKEIMPHKIELNMEYINNRTIKSYFSIIIYTLLGKSKKG